MKKYIFALSFSICSFAGIASANISLGLPKIASTMDPRFVAPIVNSDSDVPRRAGQIYYVTSGSGGLRVINNLGNVEVVSTINGNNIVTNWQAYASAPTAQSFGTITVKDCRWRRVGENMEIDCLFQAGTVTSTEARIDLPSGFTTSTSLIPNDPFGDGVTYSVVGRMYRSGSPGSNLFNTVLAQPNKAYLNFGVADASANMMAIAGTNVVFSSELVHVKASVPVVW